MNLKHILMVVAMGLPAGAVSSDTPGHAAIDALFANFDTTVSPGCSMAVLRDGEIDYARGYGMANLDYGIANAPDTVFRIGSTSKQFTAMAIALLAEQGKLSLDDDIHKFFPAMPDYGEPVTVRQLIHHTSGIRDYLTLAELADWGEDYSIAEALGIIIRQQQLNFPPGTDFLYSNSGYFMLSQIVEVATGQTLRQWAAENMFKPLGMSHTHFHDDHRQIVQKRADGYDDADGGGFEVSDTTLDMVGDGGIYTTVEDMAKWDRNFYDNKLGKGGPALIRLVETPGRLKNGKALDYAFALGIGEFAGTREISHGGAFVGYRAGFNRYPERHLSVAVFCNYANTDPTGLARRVAGLYLETAAAGAAEKAAPGSAEAAPAIEVPAAELERLTGEYMDPANFTLRSIVLDNGVLFYDRGGDDRTRLEPLGHDRFRMAGVPALVQVSFEAQGQAMTVTVEGREPTRFEKFRRPEPASAELQAYAGAYYSQELDYVQVLKAGAAAITAEQRAGPKTLKPVKQDTFVSDDGVVWQFERDASGAVTGFEVQAGRVRNIGFVRQR